MRQGACRPEQKRLPCRFAARKSPAISGKSEEDVLKGDLSPFKRASARQIRVYCAKNLPVQGRFLARAGYTFTALTLDQSE